MTHGFVPRTTGPAARALPSQRHMPRAFRPLIGEGVNATADLNVCHIPVGGLR